MAGSWGLGPDAAAWSAEPGGGSASVPDLDSRTQRILAAADDDTDRIGEPVAVLLDLVRAARDAETAGPSPAPLDRAAMLADPDRWRGRRVGVRGRLEQVAPRPDAGDDVREWFIRTDGGPVAVLVVGGPVVRAGGPVEADAWVVRRAAAVGRDGVRRVYPLLVAVPGGVTGGLGAGPGRSGDLPLVVLAATALLATAVFARRRRRTPATAGPAAVRAARIAGRGHGDRRGGAAPPAAAADSLPGDAATALAELRARGDGGGAIGPEADVPDGIEEGGRQR